MARIPAEGGCLCGAVRYRATAEPVGLSRCHCESCRTAVGASTVAWAVFPAESFAFTKGKPTYYESSPGVTRGFCSHCGTSLTYADVNYPTVAEVTTASLDLPDDFAPTKEIWLSDKIAWEPVDAQLAHFPESSRKKKV